MGACKVGSWKLRREVWLWIWDSLYEGLVLVFPRSLRNIWKREKREAVRTSLKNKKKETMNAEPDCRRCVAQTMAIILRCLNGRSISEIYSTSPNKVRR